MSLSQPDDTALVRRIVHLSRVAVTLLLDPLSSLFLQPDPGIDFSMIRLSRTQISQEKWRTQTSAFRRWYFRSGEILSKSGPSQSSRILDGNNSRNSQNVIGVIV